MARKITLHFYRHGEKDKAGMLTDKGREQASLAGKTLAEDLQKEGKITVKCIATTVPRAIETRDKLENAIKESNNPDIELIKPSIRRKMGEGGIPRDKLHPWWEEAKKAPDIIEFWLKKDEPAAIESPVEAAAKLGTLLKIIDRISRRLEAGRPVHYVFAGHADIAALIKHISGKTPAELGAPFGYCSKVKFEFEEGKIWMEFNGKRFEVKT
jgi:broad specificity phosphatase PhoE